ncbi:MAG: TonB-dependent receptor [Bacteroidales bacterium]|nr:TonB-dependent receptor [Bacteroidales bacterium]
MVKHNISCGRYRFFEATRISRRQMIACLVFGISFFNFQLSTLKAQDTVRTLDEVMIQDVRVSNKAPLTTSTVSREELDDSRAAVSLPYQLETQTSVVASSENGTVGATSIRIRGVDASRINVNINGITLNDPESQSVFWANIPNMGGMAQSLQIQRGVGASTGGSPAFGAAINMQTLNAQNSAYGQADLGLGSWNTRQYSVSAGSGILKNGLSFDFAYSGLTSDGFLRGGQTDQQSFFGGISWYGKRTLVKLLTIIGHQNTGITWDGADSATLDADPRYNSAGEMDIDGNTFYYRNATDNYMQQHYQLYVSHLLGERWSVNAALNYTRGDGYDEYYKKNKKFSSFNMPFAGKSDFITRKIMANDSYTANLSARYTGEKSTLSLGVNALLFDGDHYGNVLWCRDTSIHLDAPFTDWYNYRGHKVDVTSYIKGTYDFNDRLNAYADLQFRMVDYTLNGRTDDWNVVTDDWNLFDDFTNHYRFFNPKAGVNYRINDNSRTYFVAGVMGREPTRSDIKDCYANGDTIKAEEMLDLELGYQIAHSRWAFSVNAYAMLYKDQLTPNGNISNAGYALMENVDKSYRLGIELEGGYRFCRLFRMDANLTLSDNKALNVTYSDFADGDSQLQAVTGNTPLALSPSVVGAAIATITPCKDAKLQLIGKYVGKQYADNTGRECYAIDPYFIVNMRASYTWHLKGTNELEAQLAVNNVLDHHYRLSAWVGDWFDDYTTPGTNYYYHSRGWLQQPGINFMGRVIYRF